MAIYPDYFDAPQSLLEVPNHCGLISIWMVLRRYRVPVSPKRITKSCWHTKKHGVFTIGVAVGLRKHGLKVSFYSMPDPDLHPLEKRLYRQAVKLGVKIDDSPLSLSEVLQRAKSKSAVVVYYHTSDGVGHLSPLAVERNRVLLPTDSDTTLPVEVFGRRWASGETLCQCVIASPSCGSRLAAGPGAG